MFVHCGGQVKLNFVVFHGFTTDFIDICTELMNNKLPRNSSGGDGNRFENEASLFHTA